LNGRLDSLTVNRSDRDGSDALLSTLLATILLNARPFSNMDWSGRPDIDDSDGIGDGISEDSDDGLSLSLIHSGELYLLDGGASSLD
jgi:hypothetical protein